MNLNVSLSVAKARTGINDKQLAEKVGLSPVTISKIRRENSTGIKTVDKIAKAFGMSICEFIALGE